MPGKEEERGGRRRRRSGVNGMAVECVIDSPKCSKTLTAPSI